MKDYFKGDIKTHLTGVLGGIIWMTGMVVSFMAIPKAGPTISYALTMVHLLSLCSGEYSSEGV